MPIWCFLFLLLPLRACCAPTIRRDPSEIPTAPISNGNCRIRLNELNIYPSGSYQFVELIRVCREDPQKVFEPSFEDSKKRSTYKLAFISHDGYLVGVCDLKGKMKSRSGPHLFFTIGGEHYHDGTTRDMKIEDCNYAGDDQYARAHNRFPVGDHAPLGLALIHNQSPTVLTAISLDKVEDRFKKVVIDAALKKKILQNLQDFLVYTSTSPYTDCSYFRQFYDAYNPSAGHYVIRDWAQTDDDLDYSRSRCPRPGESKSTTWLPFMPKSYYYAPASPNAPNKCEKSVSFVIEDLQIQRTTKRVDFGSTYSCVITTSDDAIDSLHTITHPLIYATKLKELIKEKAEVIARAIQEVLPTGDECSDLWPATAVADNFDVDQDVTQAPVLNPVSQELFEQQLEMSAPHIWTSCEKFQPRSLISYLRTQKNPDINPDELTNPEVCTWFEYLIPTKKFRCRLCSQLLTQGIIAETKGSKLRTAMMTTTGQGYSGKTTSKALNSRFIKEHVSNPIHKIALDYYALFDAGLRGKELQQSFQRVGGPLHKHVEATENQFRNVFQCVRLDIPFLNYEISTETLEFFDVNLGFLYHNPTGYKAMLMSISKSMHGELLNRLVTSQPILSVMIDTSTDVSSMATLAVVFHVFGEKGEVDVVLYRILKVTKGETAEALFELFTTALGEDGLENYVKKKCVGFSSDGGPNVVKFRKLFNSYTDHELAAIHCMNHRLELSIKKAWKDIPEISQIEELVNTVYGLFHRSAKKKIILNDISAQEGEKEFSLKRIIKTRWMASRARAINSIFEHWKPIVSSLSEIKNDRSFKVDQRIKASMAYEMLMDPIILSTLAFTADVCEAIGSLSLKMQERGTSVIGKKENREMLQDTVTRLMTESGPRLELLLKATKLQGDTHTEVELVEFEEQPVIYEGITLISTGDVYFHKLSTNRINYLQPVVDQIDAYFPDDITDRFDVLDPTRWAAATLNSFGNDDMKELNSALLWNYDELGLASSWNDLKTSVYSHKDFQSQKKETAEIFWQFYLLEDGIKWTEITRAIVTSILTVQSSTAEVERIYSMYTHTKTPQRYSLEVTTVDAIVRTKFNGPKKLKDFKAREYALNFLRDHSRADDETRRRPCVRGVTETILQEPGPPTKQMRVVEGATLGTEALVQFDNLDDQDDESMEFLELEVPGVVPRA